MNRASVRSVLADPIFLAGTISCLLVIGVAAWWLYRAEPEPAAPVRRLPNYLLCPSCKEKVPYDPSLIGQACTSCDAGTAYVVDEGLDEGTSNRSRTVVFVLVAMLIVEMAIFLGVSRFRHHRRSAAREASRRLVWRCPFCRMKFSYTVAQIGTGYRCSRCKTAFDLPGADEDDE